MKHIVVIDPGMMEAGGHHAALLSTLISYDDVGSKNVSLITHKQLAPLLEKQATEQGIRVVKHFTSNFYENYERVSSIKAIAAQRYIRKLAGEYFDFFTSAGSTSIENRQTTYFYPCLNWDHALALHLALSLVEQKHISIGGNQHKICCMFTPSEDTSTLKALAYKQSFGVLSKKQNVRLFASDFETREYYKALGIPIEGTHPCYLLPWGQVETKTFKKNKNEPPTILLYLGDAKENKGFNRLPTLIKELLEQYGNEVTLILQYTLAWDYPELQKSIRDIDIISKSTPQLKLYKEYWNTNTLVNQLNYIDYIYCTYCLDTYKNKSSGIAWLASFFGIPVVLYGECWLSREFDRLDHDYSYVGNTYDTKNARASANNADKYFDSLFASLIRWLEE